MQEKDIISTKQYTWMLFSIITSFSTLQIASMLISHSGRDSWLSVICAWFIDVVLAIVYAYMGLRFPGENMVQYSMTILGKFIGRLVGALFCIFFLLSTSVLIRSLCTLLKNAFFPETPLEVLIGISFILIAVGAKKGLEVFARISQLLGPVYLVNFIILFLGLVSLIGWSSLRPFLAKDFFPVLNGSPFILSYISICIIMGMYIPCCNKPEDGFKGKFIAVTLGSLMFEIEVVAGVGILGAEQSGAMTNVGFQLAKIISFGGIFEHVEVIFLIVAVAAGVMSAMSLIWAFSLGTSQITGLSTYKPIVYPAALLAFIITVTSFDTSKDIFTFVHYTFPFLALFVESGLELFLFATALIFRKKGSAKKPKPASE